MNRRTALKIGGMAVVGFGISGAGPPNGPPPHRAARPPAHLEWNAGCHADFVTS